MSELSRQLVLLNQLHIHLDSGCSLTCRSCSLAPRPAKNGQGKKRLPGELAIQAMREALPLGLRAVRLVGPASLLHPDLGALLDRLESLELNVAIETDGSGVTIEQTQRLARLPSRSVWIALDGVDASTHEAIRGQAGSFQTVTRAIRTLAEAGLGAQVVFTVWRSNAGQIPGVIKLVERLGGAAILFRILEPGPAHPLNGDNGHQRQYMPDSDQANNWPAQDLQVPELIALGWRVERELANTTRLNLLFDLPPVFRGLHPKSSTGGLPRQHEAGHRLCGVLNSVSLLPGGEYALCGLGAEQPIFVLGQAGVDSLEMVWSNQPLLQVLRQGMPERLEGVCQRCTLKATCMGFCAGENYILEGTFWSPHWFCETAERAGLFPAGRLVENTW